MTAILNETKQRIVTQDTPVSCFVSDADSLTVNSARCACLPASSLMDNGRCYAAYNQGQTVIHFYHKNLLPFCLVFRCFYIPFKMHCKAIKMTFTGPCEYGHWFVYDRSQQPAKCLPKKVTQFPPFIY